MHQTAATWAELAMGAPSFPGLTLELSSSSCSHCFIPAAAVQSPRGHSEH